MFDNLNKKPKKYKVYQTVFNSNKKCFFVDKHSQFNTQKYVSATKKKKKYQQNKDSSPNKKIIPLKLFVC